MWTRFFDMSSGGYEKEPWTIIYIEGNEETATEYFTRRFGHSANNVTCDCCGSDYSVTEYPSLEEARQWEGDYRSLSIPYEDQE